MGRMYIPPEQLPGSDVSREVKRMIEEVLESLRHLDTPERSGFFREQMRQEASRLVTLERVEGGYATIPYVSELSTAKVYFDEEAAHFASGTGDEEELLQRLGVFRRAVEWLHRVVPREIESQSSHPATVRRVSGFTRVV